MFWTAGLWVPPPVVNHLAEVEALEVALWHDAAVALALLVEVCVGQHRETTLRWDTETNSPQFTAGTPQ